MTCFRKAAQNLEWFAEQMGNEKVEIVGTDMHTVTTLGAQNIQQLMAITKTVLIIIFFFAIILSDNCFSC